MARPTPKDLEIKATLEAAATKLRAGKPVPPADRVATADAIALVLSRQGRSILGRLYDDEAGTTNVPIRMALDLREHLKSAASAAHATLSDDAADALAQFIDGTFTPDKPQRAPRSAPGTTAATGNLNVTPPASLVTRAGKAATARTDELGWTPRPSNVITAYLIAKYGRPEGETTE